MADTLVFGAGWMGTQFAQRIDGALLVPTDIADTEAVEALLTEHGPTRVLNCAGKTGSPNIDSCEKEPEATYRSNVLGPLVLAMACRKRGIHFTHMGSGCIYSGDNDGAGFSEEDTPNFTGSLYSRTKLISEAALRDLDVLQFRIRMPLSRAPGPRNLLSKLLRYPQVISLPNSITVLEDFWGPAIALMDRKETGVWNMVNEGIELHDDLLRLYQQMVDPDHAFEVIDLATLDTLIVAKRSNCVLNTQKLRDAGLAMPHINESLPALVKAYGEALETA